MLNKHSLVNIELNLDMYFTLKPLRFLDKFVNKFE